MKRNGRLSLAIHALGHMASDPARLFTSAEIADHIGTNAVVVRRVLGGLREVGLLKSEKGHAGGWSLTRAPEKITLADVYLALDERLIAQGDTKTHSTCSLEQRLHKKVSVVLGELEEDLIQKLTAIPLSKISES